jgi:hypothetical protein
MEDWHVQLEICSKNRRYLRIFVSTDILLYTTPFYQQPVHLIRQIALPSKHGIREYIGSARTENSEMPVCYGVQRIVPGRSLIF